MAGLVIWTTTSFTALFLVALAGYPFSPQQAVVAGVYVGIASGVAWGISVHGSLGWSSVCNYIAALAALVSLAYLTSGTFKDSVCDKDVPTMLCGASRSLIDILNAVFPFLQVAATAAAVGS
jgi:hypothetical protein